MSRKSSDSEPGRRRLRNWVVGCGALVVLAMVVAVIGGIVLTRPFLQAIDGQAAVEERYGDLAAYTPAADGAVPAERIEAFLEVRESLAGLCRDFEETAAGMQRMEEMDGREEVPRGELLGVGLKTAWSMFGVGPRLGQLYEVRNRGLLDAEMSFGEYTYIYVMAYHDRLSPVPGEVDFFTGDAINGRIQSGLAEMLERQLAQARTLDPEVEMLAALEIEVAAMREDRGRGPWRDGVPPAVEASLAPYDRRLVETFCNATRELELLATRRRGLVIEGE